MSLLEDELRQTIREQDHVIEVLKGALAGANIPVDMCHAPWMQGLTPQQRVLVGVLLVSYPNFVPRGILIEEIPSQRSWEDRQLQLVGVLICRLRSRFGWDAIETERDLGVRLGSAFRDSLLVKA